MKIPEALKSSKFDKTEAEIILADLLGKDRSYIIAHPEYNLSKGQMLSFTNKLKRREKHEPLAYILGYKEFYGLKFFIDSRVLIPRPETEKLIDETIAFVNKTFPKKKIKIADVGTGSGCIAITLARLVPAAKIYAVDVDEEALVVARKNSTYHKTNGKITFLKGGLLSPLPKNIDIIVANLPYIPTGKIGGLQPEITKWEPKVALDGGADGMDLYQDLFKHVNSYLNLEGVIFYEFDGKIYQKRNASG